MQGERKGVLLLLGLPEDEVHRYHCPHHHHHHRLHRPPHLQGLEVLEVLALLLHAHAAACGRILGHVHSPHHHDSAEEADVFPPLMVGAPCNSHERQRRRRWVMMA